jgi:S-(hydroxymethyl)glutathione dehydrogenase / alcohol dehydrogenase
VQMQAAVLREPSLEALRIESVMLDGPREREVLMQVRASGICHSDYHFMTGTLPLPRARILGHEVSGTVVDIGERVSAVKAGDRVVACLAMGCGHCRECTAGWPNLCSQRARLTARPVSQRGRIVGADGNSIEAGSGIGGLAEHALVDERGLVAIPEWMPFIPAALLGCGVLTGTGAVFRSARVRAGSTVTVIGCGGVGLSIVQAARISGATTIVAVDRSVDRLAAAEVLGATATVQATGDPAAVRALVRDATAGLGADYAFEAVGNPATVRDAFMSLGPKGVATIVGVFPEGVDIAVSARFAVSGERRLQGSYMGSSLFRRDILELCELYRMGQLRLDEMVDPVLELADASRGFSLLAQAEGLRPVVTFGPAEFGADRYLRARPP